MAIIRSFTNGNQVVDWTEELLYVPNEWGTIRELGLFDEVPVAENTITFEKYTQDGGLIVDKIRGERNNVNKDFKREIRSFPVPHFPLDDSISPFDIQGQRAYGQAAQEENLAAVRGRKMEAMRRKHAWTLEYARAQCLTTGNVYAPSGTVSQNWYTEFGLTQQVVDFTLGSGTAEPIAKQEQAQAYIQDNLGNGGNITGVVGLCSPEFFAKLIAHPTVKTAYQYYTAINQRNGAQPLRDRLGGQTAMHREFVHGNILYIEMRDQYEGKRLIPAGDCYFVATGTDAFKTYFGPANKFEFVNTLGEQVYMFEYAAPTGDKIQIETEANFLNVMRRPAAVVRGTTSN